MTATAAAETQPSSSKKASARPGGGFLVAPVPREVFCREQVEEEVLELVAAAEEFWHERVLSRVEDIEDKKTVEVDGVETPLGVALLREAGELGLLSLDIPEAYGGMEVDKITSFRVTEVFGGCASQAATNGAHAGIGTLPIVYFGNEDQKQRYLEKLGTAELVGCYALTEPGAGSDALSGRTKATLADDGSHYKISGEKIYITNGAWADLAIVFARLDGKYSAFIVDLHQEGVSRGLEEQKMGIHGSSTTTLAFDDVKVPLENLLGEKGDAAKIALNILYLGRLKLGVAAMGSCKYVIDRTVKFGLERKQFGQAVLSFEMQKTKLADMVVRTFEVDSACYRMIGEMESCLEVLEDGPEKPSKEIGVMRRFGPETSIIKIYGSETLMRVANHAVRMHGGYGFCREYQVERVMRDNVVDTIFEGTNDINRMICFGDTVKNIYMAEMPFREFTEDLHRRLREGDLEFRGDPSPVRDEEARLVALKRALVYVIEKAMIGVGKDVRVEQAVMAEVASAMTEVYGAESSVARIRWLLSEGKARGERATVLEAVAKLALQNAIDQTAPACRRILAHVTKGGNYAGCAEDLERLLAGTAPVEAPLDVYGLENQVADYVIDCGKYPF